MSTSGTTETGTTDTAGPIDTHDTIAAVATAAGRSARAIVRLSGPGTDGVVRTLAGEPLGARGARRVVLALSSAGRAGPGVPGSLPLPACLLSMPGPASYTGEDSAELLVTGNRALVTRVLSAVLEAGARLAGPGEFTSRAYLAGRLTVSEAEGVAALIAAERDGELERARSLLSGDAGRRYAEWADRLAGFAALVEAGVDFTDQEDVVPIPAAELRSELSALAAAIEAELGGAQSAERPAGDPAVALVGPPSAGKSTLFNALLGRRRAVVDGVPGTTRDVLEEPLDLGAIVAGGPFGGRVRLLDLPGLDADAAGEIGEAAQRSAKAALAGADLLVHCDPDGVFDPAGLPEGTRVVRVRTKADLVPGSGSEGAGNLAVCALDGWRLDALRLAIADSAESRSGACVVPRHRRAFAEALASLREAVAAIGSDTQGLAEPELVAVSIRGALDGVGSVSGRVTPDDVLGRIFAGFCVGK